MRIKGIILSLAILGGAQSQATSATDLNDAVIERRTHMAEFNAAMQGLGQQIMSGKPDRAAVLDYAKAIQELSKALPGWFPAGSGSDKVADSAALPGIWESPDDFAAKAAALVQASDDLAQLADKGDLRQLMSKAMAVDGSCVACHNVYQKR
ncbi:c-type cytochrome [Sphingomonas montanisoli]|uniref:Cytochrome c n=1 Tax=Sphingomonas montanisoli TaxID=2606412 RepID=A0A5D9C6Y7_9SPHN|nr:cytochrome c [Sphingomonas montanisoli]TZG27223.1 cytochrome c [Sphingomonas montanisoli]